jgi:secreted PhoX family phosphatase
MTVGTDDDPAAKTDFEVIAEKYLSRRSFLGRSASFGAAAFVMGAGTLTSRRGNANGLWLDFEAVPANTLDTVTVPKGFGWHVVASWGDPLWSKGAPFDHKTRGTGASQALALGDNNDGMSLFAKDGRTILAVNSEYTNLKFIYGNRWLKRPRNADDVRKGKAAHGVNIFEIQRQKSGRWTIVKDSPYNRKITPDTLIELTGPARGHDLLKTPADKSGTWSLGTWNNCGNGETPWGTYLTCEENFNYYFSSSDSDYKPSLSMKRYGIRTKDRGDGWARYDERFDISKHPNEPHRAGYIVEIDPTNPRLTPKKRTALGRFKHENAELVIARDGHVVVYSGDDSRGEFLYKFVSANKYVPGGDNTDLLEDGRLFAAKFHHNGRGEWLELTPSSTGMKSKAEICILTRQAGSAVKATTMDRPEWVAANPNKVEVCCSLTKNKNRGRKPNAGGDATPVGGPNPRRKNRYGQIVRWTPDNADHAATGFSWDLFVVAGNPTVHQGSNAGSPNVTADNMFSSPDGLKFDRKGGLWIQTDGNYSNKGHYAGQGNNQMMLGNTATGEIKRFLVGPKQCEVTGICWSADRRTLFVGIQHPGESGDSHFPAGGNSVPRSSIVAITRNDGGLMG